MPETLKKNVWISLLRSKVTYAKILRMAHW
jgi:hypothetical protein